MLANQSDFMAYAGAFKSNYRKGVHRLETILSNPTHAAEFAANLGGVSVILGVPISLPDRNSDKLLELLLGSDVADDAVETWLHQFYEFTGWDDLLSDSARCKEMANNPLIWRAAGGSKLAVGKSIATLAGLSCSAYKDIDAVAASQVAMAAVIGNRRLRSTRLPHRAWQPLTTQPVQQDSIRPTMLTGPRLQPLRLLWRP